MNKSLNDVEWKEMPLTKLFKISGSKTTSKKVLEKVGCGHYPYVTTQTTNNGQAGYYNYYTEKGNVLTVDSAVVGFCTYQTNNFSASDHVEILIPKFEINKYIALFLTTQINRSNQEKFSYGYKACQDRLKKTLLMLPVTSSGEPDYKFMEEYIKEKENALKKQYKKYVEKYFATDAKLPDKPYKWKEFELCNLFNIYTGTDLILNRVINGSIPVISHSIENNGVSSYSAVIPERKIFDYKKSISLADRGNFKAYVQKQNFYIGTRVKGLESKQETNKYILNFISRCIDMQSVKFSYGNNACKRLDSLKILLPITPEGSPDYDYMENYMKYLEQEKLKKYLDYIK